MSVLATQRGAIAEADIWKGPEHWGLTVRACPLCGSKTSHGGGPTRYVPLLGYRACHGCGGSIRLILSAKALAELTGLKAE